MYDLFTKETECVTAPELLFQSPQFIYSGTRSSVAISRYAQPLKTAVVDCVVDRVALHASENGNKF
jgi:hypothetical protein